MLCQHGTVADRQIANPFPGNQIGTIIANANWHDYCKRKLARLLQVVKGVCPLYEDRYFRIIASCINEKTKGVFE